MKWPKVKWSKETRKAANENPHKGISLKLNLKTGRVYVG